MFPFSDSIHVNKPPYVTILFTLVILCIFGVQSRTPEALIPLYALSPNTVSLDNYKTLLPFVTAIFLHGGFLQMIISSWFLFIFGQNVEAYYGHIRFGLIFLFCGVMGNFLQYMIAPHSLTPFVGASGAIAGILAGYLILFPLSEVRTMIPILFFMNFWGIFSVPFIFILGYYFLLQFLVGNIQFLPNQHTDLISLAPFSLIGGFVVGLLIAMIFPKQNNFDS